MRSILFAFTVFALSSCGNEQSKTEESQTAELPNHTALQTIIDSIAQSAKAKIAIASIHIETGDTFYYNATDRVPTQSTIKFPLAVMIMKQVDSGRLSLDEPFTLTKEELATPGGKSLLEALNGKTSMRVHALLEYMTHVSDNISCSGFTRQVGGAKQIEASIKSTGLQGIGVSQTEGKPYIDFSKPYGTWCTAKDMAKLLVKFYTCELLSKTSTDTLRSIMERTTGGTNRIKGLLPAGTIVAHKTGSSATENNKTAAVNDVGVITLPNGQHLAVAVYVHDIAGDMTYGESIIATVAKVIYDDAIKK